MRMLVVNGVILLVLLWGAAWLQWRSERATREQTERDRRRES